jgi:hypothetical protein
MKRRHFGQVLAGSAIGAGAASYKKLDIISANAAPIPRKNLLFIRHVILYIPDFIEYILSSWVYPLVFRLISP